MKTISLVLVALFGLVTAAIAQSSPPKIPLLGEAYASGHVYLLPPDETQDWPDSLSFSGPKISPDVTGLLDRVLRDVHPPTLEDTPASRGKCRPDTKIVEDAPDDGVFDRGTPDNCETDPRVALYAPVAKPGTGLVLGWPGVFTGPPDTSKAGKPRPMSAAETKDADGARESFKAEYEAAFGIAYDSEASPIGKIQTLADATIIAEFSADDATLRLSEWERITPAQHIYHHYVLDVIRFGKVDNTFVFSRPQGVLG